MRVKADRSRIDVSRKEDLLARIEQRYLEPLLLNAQAIFALIGEISLPANQRNHQLCGLRAKGQNARCERSQQQRYHALRMHTAQDFRHLYIHCTAMV